MTYIKNVGIKTNLLLLVASTLSAPRGAMLTTQINLDVSTANLTLVIFMAAIRMFFQKKITMEWQLVLLAKSLDRYY
jgi:uncharacterized membrane protein YfcA